MPQGGNTGLVGGQTPLHGEVVLSLNRLDKIREVDPISNTITCEAGVTLQRAREAAAEVDRLYPQLLPSEGTCTIGGNLSTNAGGTAALAHGIARSHALGLEVVLADGRVLNNLNKLKKDNTGYDLKNLFIGAEGTLGIITAAVLRLVPRPRSVETAFVGVPSPQAALDLLGLATERTAGGVTSFEIMLRDGRRHRAQARRRQPRSARRPASLVRADRTVVAGALGPAREPGSASWRTASSAAWSTTPPSPTASTRPRRSGASARCSARCRARTAARSSTTSRCRSRQCRPSSARRATRRSKLIPGARPLPFGHLGDGNIHYNVTQPVGADKAEYLERWDDMNDVVFAIVKKYGGSISAEHGIGVMKRDLPAEGEGPGRLRPDAHAQAHARSQGHPQSRQGAVAATCSLTPASHLSPEGPHGRSGLPANFLRPIAALSAPIFFFAVTRKPHSAAILLQSRNTSVDSCARPSENGCPRLFALTVSAQIVSVPRRGIGVIAVLESANVCAAYGYARVRVAR